MKPFYFLTVLLLIPLAVMSQAFSGLVTDDETGTPLNNVRIRLVENNQEQITSNDGSFSFFVGANQQKTVQFQKEGYIFKDIQDVLPTVNLSVKLRKKKTSSATTRWNDYLTSCNTYSNPRIPNDPTWNVEFTETNLIGDFAANSRYTRRDPSAVIQYNGLYYVWYTYKISERSTYFNTNNVNDNVFPWDHADLYYATSPDGYQWTERGPAVLRGASGSYDDRSVFTPEIFEHENKFYLVYQAVKHPYIERVKNTVAMSVADSPDGPWTKLEKPILRPTDNGIWSPNSTSRFDVIEKGDFDSHKVHDPCIRFYKNKFYLYYKGERMGEDRYCGQREIRWGVAIADQPTGPYVKSEYNPITTTGHEVSVWNYKEGIAIIQHLDGPERGSIQYAEDGVNFEMMGKASNVPDALGIFRSDTDGTSPRFGVSWGLCHVLRWDQVGGGWMFLRRFDLVNPPANPNPDPDPNPPTDTDDLVIEVENFSDTGTNNNYTPGGYFGVNATDIGVNFVNSQDWMEFDVTFPESGDYELTYFISTPMNRANVQMQIDGQVVANDVVRNNREWDQYYPLISQNTITVDAGIYTIRVTANGSNRWQWNMDKFQFRKIDSRDDSILSQNFDEGDKFKVFPNPATSSISITDIKKTLSYTIFDLQGVMIHTGVLKTGAVISLTGLSKGAYLIKMKDDDYIQSSVLIKK